MLLVVLQANYQNTPTYLQCKVFTAEPNTEILVKRQQTFASDGLYDDRIMIIKQVHNTRINIKTQKIKEHTALLGAGWMNTYQYFRGHCWCLENNQRNP